jgi:hypothetical protein
MIVNASLGLVAVVLLLLNFKETLEAKPQATRYHKRLSLRQKLAKLFSRRTSNYSYQQINYADGNNSDTESMRLSNDTEDESSYLRTEGNEKDIRYPGKEPDYDEEKPTTVNQPSFSYIAWRISVRVVMGLHLTSYATAMAVFLPAKVSAGASTAEVIQSHGLGFSVFEIGVLTTVVTVLAFPMQIIIFPRLHDAIGSLNCLRYFLPLSTIAYLGLTILSNPPGSEIMRLLFAAIIMAIHLVSRTVCQPSALLLINDASEDQEQRSKVQSITHASDSAASAIGLVMGGLLIRASIQLSFTGLAWLIIAVFSIANIAIVQFCIR